MLTVFSYSYLSMLYCNSNCSLTVSCIIEYDDDDDDDDMVCVTTLLVSLDHNFVHVCFYSLLLKKTLLFLPW